jgi:hypothetical protein
MTFIVRTDRPSAGSVLTGLADSTQAAVQPLSDEGRARFRVIEGGRAS